MLQSLTMKNFINELSSNSPAPGGGSAAALAASLASALGSMVFNLTVGKKAYEAFDESRKSEIIQALNELNLNKDEFLNLMEKDAQEFLELMVSFKLPKGTEEEKKYRQEKIDEGYIKALQAPLEVAVKAFDIYKFIELSAMFGNKSAVSDAGVAALLLQTAIESAVLNVKINLPGLKDENYKKEIDQQCRTLVEEGLIKKEEILKVVMSRL
jgi:formiminotetrahydrofolate cyclodeaminase